MKHIDTGFNTVTPVCVVYFTQIQSSQTAQPARPLHPEFVYVCDIVSANTSFLLNLTVK